MQINKKLTNSLEQCVATSVSSVSGSTSAGTKSLTVSFLAPKAKVPSPKAHAIQEKLARINSKCTTQRLIKTSDDQVAIYSPTAFWARTATVAVQFDTGVSVQKVINLRGSQ